MATSKTATPVSIIENNKNVITATTPIELVVVGEHLEFDPHKINAGVIVKPV